MNRTDILTFTITYLVLCVLSLPLIVLLVLSNLTETQIYIVFSVFAFILVFTLTGRIERKVRRWLKC